MNTASRLESLGNTLFAPDADSRPCRISIGEPTSEYLEAKFETEPVGEVSPEGQSSTPPECSA